MPLDFVNMAGSDTYLESVVVINRIKFMLYFSYSFESQFTLVHVLCQCCMNSTLRFSTENTSITLLIFQSVYSLFYWQSMCVISLICLCKCVLSLDCSFNQMGFSNTCKKYYITTFLSVYTFNFCSKCLWWGESKFYFNRHPYVVQFIPHVVNLKYLYAYKYIKIGEGG